MNILLANTCNEVEKILYKKKNLLFLLLTVLIPMGAAALVVLGEDRLGIFAVTAATFPIVILDLFSGILLPLFIFSIFAELFSGELGDKTIKLTLTRPISRFKVYLSKTISVGFFIGIALVLLGLTTILASIFLSGGMLNSSELAQVLLAYTTAFVPMIFLCITAAFVCQFFANSGAALITLVIGYITAKIIPFLAPVVGKVSPFSYTDWYMLWLGNQVGLGKLLNLFGMFLGSSLILFAAGFYWFDRRDL